MASLKSAVSNLGHRIRNHQISRQIGTVLKRIVPNAGYLVFPAVGRLSHFVRDNQCPHWLCPIISYELNRIGTQLLIPQTVYGKSVVDGIYHSPAKCHQHGYGRLTDIPLRQFCDKLIFAGKRPFPILVLLILRTVPVSYGKRHFTRLLNLRSHLFRQHGDNRVEIRPVLRADTNQRQFAFT